MGACLRVQIAASPCAAATAGPATASPATAACRVIARGLKGCFHRAGVCAVERQCSPTCNLDMRQMLGRAVRVWWDGERRWYDGVVIRFDRNPSLVDSHGTRPRAIAWAAHSSHTAPIPAPARMHVVCPVPRESNNGCQLASRACMVLVLTPESGLCSTAAHRIRMCTQECVSQ